MPIDYSIIIPAYNEEDYLSETLTALHEAMLHLGLQGELIVVDNNSSDNTPSIADNHGATVVFEPVNQISRARNAGAKHAQGRYLVFVDADTVIPPELLQQALANLESGDIIGGGACIAGNIPLRFSLRILLKIWNRVSILTRNAAGSFIYCHRDAFESIGGFSENVYASEEIWLSRKLKKLGRKQKQKFKIIKHPPVITSMRKMQWYSPLRIYLYLFMIAVFPFSVRFKALCSFWYRKPAYNKND
ncbi:MAG: glycosyltransferase [Gammaproteobacteria bacterium]|nr:glycosyltransferase [Gammaproteobacteria bacterium]